MHEKPINADSSKTRCNIEKLKLDQKSAHQSCSSLLQFRRYLCNTRCYGVGKLMEEGKCTLCRVLPSRLSAVELHML